MFASLIRRAHKVIGFIDNSKPNFNHLVEDLSQVLIEKHGVKQVIKLESCPLTALPGRSPCSRTNAWQVSASAFERHAA